MRAQVAKAAKSLGENPVATLPVLQLLLDFLLRMRHHPELRAFVLRYEGEPKLRAMDADLVAVRSLGAAFGAARSSPRPPRVFQSVFNGVS